MSVIGDVVPTSASVPVTLKFAVFVVPARIGDSDKTIEPAPVEVVVPVPPFATASVPPRVIVPEVVIGPPENDNPVVPPETCTEVTVPVDVAPQIGVAPGPAEVNT